MAARMQSEARISCRVLVVDDEEPVANLVARLLRELGHQPIVVNSGIEALELIARDSFDLILSDVKMPGHERFRATSNHQTNQPRIGGSACVRHG